MLDRLNDMYLKDIEKPLQQNVIDQLPKFKFNTQKSAEESKDKKEEDSQCTVCYYDYKEGEELIMLPCFHKYHEPCITSWFKT